MNAFRYDLHIHSCLSPCAMEDMTPWNIAGMAHLNSLQIVALTDHNSAKNCPAFLKACEAYGITAVAGMELTTAEEIHVVCLFETPEAALDFDSKLQKHRMKIKNNTEIFGTQWIWGEADKRIGEDPFYLPAATDLPLAAAYEMVAAHGGICYPAHIDREANGLLAVLGAFPETPVFHLAELHNPEKQALAEGRKVIVSSDAHRLWEISAGKNFLHLNAEKEDAPEAIRRALFQALRQTQTGDFQAGGCRESIEGA